MIICIDKLGHKLHLNRHNMHHDAEKWCFDNIGERGKKWTSKWLSVEYAEFYFSNKSNLTWFKMTWL